jgi:hypothetical protein
LPTIPIEYDRAFLPTIDITVSSMNRFVEVGIKAFEKAIIPF